jgi:hypothetical protein
VKAALFTAPLDAWRSCSASQLRAWQPQTFYPREGSSDLKAKAPRIWAGPRWLTIVKAALLSVPLDAWRSCSASQLRAWQPQTFYPREGSSDLKAKAPRIWAKASMALDVASMCFLFSSMSWGVTARRTDLWTLTLGASTQVGEQRCLHPTPIVLAPFRRSSQQLASAC